MQVQDLFIGSDQSKYAAMAIVISLIAVAFTVLFSQEKIPLGQKLVIVVLMFLLSLPAMLFSLFQITCLVTGTGFRNSKWWCGAYAWFITVLVIIYAIVIVVMSVMSLTEAGEVKKIEQFYNQKGMYDEFANDTMAEEKKAQVAGSPPANVTVPEVPVEMPMVTAPPPPAASPMTPPAAEMTTPTMTATGNAAPPVEAFVEPFTSCGAAWTNTY